MEPRINRLSLDDYYMMLALLTAQRSYDPNTQVGSALRTEDRRPNGVGYNGPPKGICASTIPWNREGSPEDTKYPYIVHAEQNCIENAARACDAGVLYVTLFPCNECAKTIIQAGIQEVIYLEDKYADLWQTKVSKKLLDQAGINIRQHKWSSLSSLRPMAEFIVGMTGG